MPNPPLTPDQVELLKRDNVASPGRVGLVEPRHHADPGRGDPADLSRPFPARRLVRAAAVVSRFYRRSLPIMSRRSSLIKDDHHGSAERLLLLVAALIFGGKAMAADPENTLYMDVPAGRVVIEMRPDLAPATSRRSRRWCAAAFMTGCRSIA